MQEQRQNEPAEDVDVDDKPEEDIDGDEESEVTDLSRAISDHAAQLQEGTRAAPGRRLGRGRLATPSTLTETKIRSSAPATRMW